MTGYGKGSFATEKLKITVEIKSVNSKQLDLMIRTPSLFREQETLLRNRISPKLERGKIELTVSYQNLSEELPVKINNEVVKAYKKQILNLAKELDINAPADWMSLLLRLPESLSSENQEALEEEKEALMEAAEEAVDNLLKYRLKEGESLYYFFFSKIERIREYLNHIEQFETGRVSKIREKIEYQLAKLTGIEIDRGRLEQEMIFYIEKLDITEEKLRLRSHLTYFEETLGEPHETEVGGKGKKLGFIAQEMGREINTLGSKSNDADMQKLVVMMKDELEQIKEQVLNVL